MRRILKTEKVRDMTKSELRAEYKQKRKALTAEEVQTKSRQIAKHVLEMKEYVQADLVMAYLPIMNEVDTTPIIADALERGKTVVIPKVDGDSMEFFVYRPSSELEQSSFHVSEPVIEEIPVFSEEIMARGVRRLMLVPGLVFGGNGLRIGYGKGFYDRYLSKDPVLTVGLCYDLQLLEKIEGDSFDIPLNYIVTENQVTEVL